MLHRTQYYRRAAIAPLCLCLVAGLHAWRVARLDQTPWKGGGFGMFSTVDSEAARFLRCYAIAAEGQRVPLAVPPVLSGWEAELRVVPTPARLAALAERLAEMELQSKLPTKGRKSWATNGFPDGKTGVAQASRPPRSTELTRVHAEIWRYRFDAASHQLRAERLLAATHPRQEASP